MINYNNRMNTFMFLSIISLLSTFIYIISLIFINYDMVDILDYSIFITCINYVFSSFYYISYYDGCEKYKNNKKKLLKIHNKMSTVASGIVLVSGIFNHVFLIIAVVLNLNLINTMCIILLIGISIECVLNITCISNASKKFNYIDHYLYEDRD